MKVTVEIFESNFRQEKKKLEKRVDFSYFMKKEKVVLVV